MRVLYLFNNVREGVIENIKMGLESDDHFFGMLRLPKYGVRADYAEIEQYFPRYLATFLRSFINIYYIHLLVFWRIFYYDVVFTSSAFGSQFFHAFLSVRHPRWVMYDFSIVGLIGDGKNIKQKVFRWMTGKAAGIITLSRGGAEKLRKDFPYLKEKIEFIPFGVDLSFFCPKENITEENQILTVGLSPDRDYKMFFEAVRGVDARIVATKSRTLDSLVGIPSYVKAKFFSARELVEEYARSKIVVLPLDVKKNTNNAMGCSTLVEAMAMGKAIIVTRTLTTESYITNGVNGLLVEPGNAESLRLAILSLLQNDEKRKKLGENARAFARKNCAAELVAEKMANFFKKINA